ncbi:MAG TPA: glycoside hydrolase family 32 protein, partial [Flavisolibacter sp.]|nr:glycoside hydrolase family 32 protein [Flavisolibacter sp.]
GPFGAVKGVWECPDFFPLQVDGKPQQQKWVLVVSVQPLSGQYFIGDFDGKTFTLDPEFRGELKQLKKQSVPKGEVLFDFEKDLKGWQIQGTAFSASPAPGSLKDQNPVLGFMGRKLINSFFQRDESMGEMISPEFIINKKFLNFLIGGGANPEKLSVNLIVDGKTVRTKTGTDAEVLNWASWDVGEFSGKKAHLQVLDHQRGDFGHILLDQVMLSDVAAKTEREKAFWLDYGPDFYAVRSWGNMPLEHQRRVWTAWLGSWLYIRDVPSNPWKGGHTFPRSVELKRFPEGIRLVQNPIPQIQNLRGRHFTTAPAEVKERMILNTPATNSYEFSAEFELDKTGKIALNICADGNQKTTIAYDAASATLTLDRSHSGRTDFNPSFPALYSAPLKLKNKRLKLHVLVDQSNVEIFAEDGRVAITSLIFPDRDARQISLYPESGSVKLLHFDLWEINSIWHEKTDSLNPEASRK